jgi:nucleoside-diphosphate-sugar epimerase
MNCVVTGASGFIGSALIKRLIQDGHHVRAVVHITPPQDRDSRVEYVVADLTNPASLSSLVHHDDVVFHCAALVKDFGSKKEIMEVNLRGTQHLVDACHNKIQRFIFLGHLHQFTKGGAYSSSKARAEQYLLDQHRTKNFPVVIIRPGNVYGPGATTWCLRPLQAIQHDRIALINNGTGLFLHTYIDNLLDGLISAMTAPQIVGEVIDITDGDNTTTWKTYLNELAALAGKPPIHQTMRKTTASLISTLMMLRYFLFHTDPLVTPFAVRIFTNQQPVSIEKATRLLGYRPSIDYAEGMKRTAHWLTTEHYI